MGLSRIYTSLLACACCAVAPTLNAAELASTLVLGEGSAIVVDDDLVLSLPAGSTIGFSFGEAQEDGSVPVTVPASEVNIDPVALPNGQRMLYTITDAGTGNLRRGESGLILALSVTVRVGIVDKMGREARDYPISFTTETAIATNDVHTKLRTLQGQRVSEAARSVKLVGGATNASDAVVGEGKLVGAVLVGTFDRLPVLQP